MLGSLLLAWPSLKGFSWPGRPTRVGGVGMCVKEPVALAFIYPNLEASRNRSLEESSRTPSPICSQTMSMTHPCFCREERRSAVLESGCRHVYHQCYPLLPLLLPVYLWPGMSPRRPQTAAEPPRLTRLLRRLLRELSGRLPHPPYPWAPTQGQAKYRSATHLASSPRPKASSAGTVAGNQPTSFLGALPLTAFSHPC